MIWLVIPGAREGARGSGQWKDLQGIRIVLGQLGSEWREFRFDEKNLDALIAQIGDSDATVIWYYTFWPEAMEDLKAKCPRIRIVLRTVNAEAFQHWTRADKDWRRFRGLPRDIYGGVRLLWRDRRCCRAADALAGIAAWDDDHYWSRLAGRSKVKHVPYVCPWPDLRPEVKPRPWAAREDVIACLAGTRDSIGRGHVAGLAKLARRPELSGWRFASTDGFMDASGDELPTRVERLGCIEEPWALLCRVKAVAVLSPSGYGFKTTAADAVAAGCHVLVHPRQHARLSPEERAKALSVDPGSEADICRLADALSQPPAGDAADESRSQLERSRSAWKKVLRI